MEAFLPACSDGALVIEPDPTRKAWQVGGICPADRPSAPGPRLDGGRPGTMLSGRQESRCGWQTFGSWD
jgi:hypothetical protein